jgi:hypothetical protein
LGIRDCYDNLLKLRHRDRQQPQQQQQRRPNTLSDSASMGSVDEEGGGRKFIGGAGGSMKQPTQVGYFSIIVFELFFKEQMSRKFLVAIANIDFLLNHSLASICRRLGDNGLKFADQVFKRSKVH